MVGNNTYETKLQALCVSLMNYGAAAQVNFNYKTTELMNADFADYQYMVNAYDESMITPRVTVDKAVELDNSSNSYLTAVPDFSLTLVGAIDMNFVWKPSVSGTITKAGMLVWNRKTYEQIESLTVENVTETITLTGSEISGSSFKTSFAGTPAKEMGDTVYVAAFYEIDGVTYYSGVFTRSIEYYADKVIGNTGYDENLWEAMKAMVVYGDYARAYFA